MVKIKQKQIYIMATVSVFTTPRLTKKILTAVVIVVSLTSCMAKKFVIEGKDRKNIINR